MNKFNHCRTTSFGRNAIASPYCCPTNSPGTAIPESARIENYPFSTATVYSQSVAVPQGVVPIVEVRSTPASVTTVARRVNAVSLPMVGLGISPDVRFAAYFPPAPLPYCPPVRIPNNEPLGPMRPCRPPQIFQGSMAEHLAKIASGEIL